MTAPWQTRTLRRYFFPVQLAVTLAALVGFFVNWRADVHLRWADLLTPVLFLLIGIDLVLSVEDRPVKGYRVRAISGLVLIVTSVAVLLSFVF